VCLALLTLSLSALPAGAQVVATKTPDQQLRYLSKRLDDLTKASQTFEQRLTDHVTIAGSERQAITKRLEGLEQSRTDTLKRLSDVTHLYSTLQALVTKLDVGSTFMVSIVAQVLVLAGIVSAGFWSRRLLRQSSAALDATLRHAKEQLQTTLNHQGDSLSKTLTHSEVSLDKSLTPARRGLWLRAFLEFTGRYAQIMERMPAGIRVRDPHFRVD
jgi:prefoldin subunit 5